MTPFAISIVSHHSPLGLGLHPSNQPTRIPPAPVIERHHPDARRRRQRIQHGRHVHDLALETLELVFWAAADNEADRGVRIRDLQFRKGGDEDRRPYAGREQIQHGREDYAKTPTDQLLPVQSRAEPRQRSSIVRSALSSSAKCRPATLRASVICRASQDDAALG